MRVKLLRSSTGKLKLQEGRKYYVLLLTTADNVKTALSFFFEFKESMKKGRTRNVCQTKIVGADKEFTS